MDYQKILSDLVSDWYIHDPVYLRLYCSHEVKANKLMRSSIRSGKGLIEYNPNKLDNCTVEEIKDLFQIELIRIALKHPYSRKPYNCIGAACKSASDCVISNNYKVPEDIKISKPLDFQLPTKESYEWYTYKIDRIMQEPHDENQSKSKKGKGNKTENSSTNKGSNKDADADATAMWEDDDLAKDEINHIIEDVVSSGSSWGSIPGSMVELIKASLTPKLDYRSILRSFHTSILSSTRALTRMKPNRRFGFAAMGSKYDLASNILVAVDTSGSVSSFELSKFLSAINRFFKYGISTLDVIQFDTSVSDTIKFKKAKDQIKLTGRGGTDFQAAVDYAKNSKVKYDGLIIFTDGAAPVPNTEGLHSKLLWVLTNESAYNSYAKSLTEAKKGSLACYIME